MKGRGIGRRRYIPLLWSLAVASYGIHLSAYAAKITVSVSGVVSPGSLDQSNTGEGVFGPPGPLGGKHYTLVFTFDDSKATSTFLPDTNGNGTVNQSYAQGTGKQSPGIAKLTIGGTTVSFGDGSVSPITTSPHSRVDRYVDGPLTTQMDFLSQDLDAGHGTDQIWGSSGVQLSAYHAATNDGDWRTSVTNNSAETYAARFSYTRYTPVPGRPGSSTFASASAGLQVQSVTVAGIAASPLSRRICFQGKDITRSQTPVEVVVGQPITMTVGTSDAPCQAASTVGQTQSWEVCAIGAQCNNTILAYTPETKKTYLSAQVTLFCSGGLFPQLCDSPASTQPTVGPFYWTTDGSHNVTFNYQLPGFSSSARVTFNVQAPTQVHADPHFGSVDMRVSVPGACSLGVFGCEPSHSRMGLVGVGPLNFCGQTFPAGDDTPGVAFCAREVDPTAYPGTLTWVQTISDSVSDNGGGSPSAEGPGLDNCYPYDSGPYFADEPSIRVDGFGPSVTQVTHHFSAETYLMWRATKVPDAIAVPIGLISWGYDGVATLNPTVHAWYVTSSNPHFGALSVSSSYPIWDEVERNWERIKRDGCP